MLDSLINRTMNAVIPGILITICALFIGYLVYGNYFNDLLLEIQEGTLSNKDIDTLKKEVKANKFRVHISRALIIGLCSVIIVYIYNEINSSGGGIIGAAVNKINSVKKVDMGFDM